MASSWRSLLKEKIHSVLFLNNGIQLEESAKEKIQCTIKRQRNKGAIYQKMTVDKRQIRAERILDKKKDQSRKCPHAQNLTFARTSVAVWKFYTATDEQSWDQSRVVTSSQYGTQVTVLSCVYKAFCRKIYQYFF